MFEKGGLCSITLHSHKSLFKTDIVQNRNWIQRFFTNEVIDNAKFHAVGTEILVISFKGNKTLGFLRRNLKIPSIRIKEQAYQTLVRPLVEYASTVWNPYTKTEINKIEAVQRRVARYVVNNQSNRSSVSNMLQGIK